MQPSKRNWRACSRENSIRNSSRIGNICVLPTRCWRGIRLPKLSPSFPPHLGNSPPKGAGRSCITIRSRLRSSPVIAERRASANHGSYASFIAANPDLLDKRCLERWYDSPRLQSDMARQNFILPYDHSAARQKLRRTVAAYTAVYVSLIIWASALTLWQGLAHQAALVWLASAEMAGAFLFLFNETRLAGLILLLLVFSIVTVADSLSGSLPIRFLIYGASAILAWRVAALVNSKKPAA
jgi:hypothetical protein